MYTCADLMSIMLWMTPAGTLDEGGVPQPAYLNFRQRLLHEPADADSFKARTHFSAAWLDLDSRARLHTKLGMHF